MFSLRPISTVLSIRCSNYFPRIFSVPRSNIPPVAMQQRTFGTWTDTILYLLTGMKRMTSEEAEQARKDHQKLWAAYASIPMHEEAHEHYERVYSLQLFKEPKDFEMMKYYSNLFKKKEEDLSLEELVEIVELYQFALGQNRDLVAFFALNQKLKKYQSVLSTRKDRPC